MFFICLWSRLVDDKVCLVLYNRKGTRLKAFPKYEFPKHCLIPLFLGNALWPFSHSKHGQKIISFGYHRAKRKVLVFSHLSYTRMIKCFHFHILFEYEYNHIAQLQSHKHLEEDPGWLLMSDFEGTFFNAMGGCYQTLLLANSLKKFWIYVPSMQWSSVG